MGLEPQQSQGDVSENLRASSNALLMARRHAKALPTFPGDLPTSLDEAYTLQSLSISHKGSVIGGWKVGLIAPGFSKDFADERLVGPIFQELITPYQGGANGAPVALPVFADGFAAVEAEIIVEIGQDIAPGSVDTSTACIQDYISRVLIGVEIASSPMPDINDLGPMAIISDFGNNFGLVVGPEIPDWRVIGDDDIDVAVTINDVEIGKATGANIPGGYQAATAFLIDICARRNISLAKGCLISTGAVTGVHQADAGSKSTADFGRYGKIDMTLFPLKPVASPAA